MNNNHTEKGLKIIIIGMVLSILNGAFTFLANNSGEVISAILSVITQILGGIGFVLILIGIILLFVGRKEFGGTHKKFVTFGLILYIVSIIIAVFLLVYIFVSFYSLITSHSLFDEGSFINDFKGLLINIIFISLVTALVEGSYKFFMVYELENKKGKTVLYAAFAVTIITVVSIGLITLPMVNNIMDEIEAEETDNSDSTLWGGSYYSSETQDTVNSDKIEYKIEAFNSQLNITSTIGIIGQILFLFAFFIPYKRIKQGELVPALPNHLKRCENCGRVVQSDHMICAYCGHHFNDIPRWRWR